MSKQLRETRKVELVETHNLTLSLDRLQNAGSYDTNRWKRALYHALAMSRAPNQTELAAIRTALGLA